MRRNREVGLLGVLLRKNSTFTALFADIMFKCGE
jgi:hypothetical protein